MIDLREQYLKGLPEDKMRLATMNLEDKVKLIERLVKEGKIHESKEMDAIYNTEDYLDLIKGERDESRRTV